MSYSRHQDESPARLRERAAGIRWRTAGMSDLDRRLELLDYADELDAAADALEEGVREQ